MAKGGEKERLLRLDEAIHVLSDCTLGIRSERYKDGEWPPLYEFLRVMTRRAEEIAQLSRDWRAEVVAELAAKQTEGREEA